MVGDAVAAVEGFDRGSGSVAIVHDYLNQRGGAERVVLELARIWPQATIYTSLYRPGSTWPEFGGHEVCTTNLQRLPIDRSFRNLFPLYPGAFRSLGEIDADIVLASSSGWAHMARTSPRAFHAVYCHTPARWLYNGEYLGGASLKHRLAGPTLHRMRRRDAHDARRADLYIANSHNVRDRIRAVYGRDAVVIPPPVDTGRFRPSPRGERLLAITRLLPYKHPDLLVRVATRAGIGLDIVGDGPMLGELRRIAGPTVTLHGAVNDRTVVELMDDCRAVCVAAEEDFGIVAVEAQAAGKPVIAYARGGALETVDDGVTGVLFEERSDAALLEAVAAADALSTSPERIAAHAAQFSSAAFRRRLLSSLSEAFRKVHR